MLNFMKIAAIIPAYNEEATVSNVVNCVKNNSHIHEVIVVDDGSFDKTAELSQKSGAKVIKLNNNTGKGNALEQGVKNTTADILLFLDADLIGLNESHINRLLEPVIKGEADMTVGAVDRSDISPQFNKRFEKKGTPISGIRALKKSFWDEIPREYKKKFYIESAITYFAKKKKLKKKPFVLKGVKHRIKEEKMGKKQGRKARLKMIGQIIFINTVLRLTPKKKFREQGLKI